MYSAVSAGLNPQLGLMTTEWSDCLSRDSPRSIGNARHSPTNIGSVGEVIYQDLHLCFTSAPEKGPMETGEDQTPAVLP